MEGVDFLAIFDQEGYYLILVKAWEEVILVGSGEQDSEKAFTFLLLCYGDR